MFRYLRFAILVGGDRLFQHLVLEDRSLLELFSADYTFVVYY